jgi:two-component SAPR family response regulator
MHIIAVDDEPLALGLLVRSIQEACPSAQISQFQSSAEALHTLEHIRCDVAFLDIHMRGVNGLTLAKKIKDLNPQCNLVFVTGYSEYATDALSMHASGYIIKPVSAEAIRSELEDLRHPVALLPDALLRIRCFGNFEVFSADGEPIKFTRTKAKELFAYLVYRRGSSCSTRELAAVLFEDNAYTNKQMLYLQKIISSMMQTLKAHNVAQVIHKSYNAIALNDKLVDCDYYRFMKMDVPSINTYTGEFMTQYSWAEFVAGYLDRITAGSTPDPN